MDLFKEKANNYILKNLNNFLVWLITSELMIQRFIYTVEVGMFESFSSRTSLGRLVDQKLFQKINVKGK